MAEAFIDNQTDMYEDGECESIVTFVEKNSSNEKIKELYDAWENICANLQIDLTYVRWKLDSWFQSCYHACQDVRRLSNEVSPEMAQRRKADLFEEFMADIKGVIEEQKESFINKFKIKAAKDDIFKNYSHNPEDWVDKAIECVEKEIELVADFKKVKIEKEKAEADQKIEGELNDARLLERKISKCIEKMKNEVTNWNQYYNKKEESEQNLSRLTNYLDQMAKNGVVSEVKQLESTIRDCETHLQKAQQQIASNHEEVIRRFDELCELLKGLVKKLAEDVYEWKTEFKLQYVELAASPNLTRIAPWCAQTGRLIYDILNVNLVSWDNILTTIEVETTQLQEFQQKFNALLTGLLQSTFVVTEQESCIIKVDKKHLPKFVVRVLAAENFPERLETITARFAFEEDINTCCHDNCLTLSTLKEKINERGIHLSANVFKFDNGKKKDQCEACFQTLHFKNKFCRQGNQTGKQVHEEKSRIIFNTKIHDQEYWTMSLPLVVTTGANQGCLSQASVMWQCYSTDVYCVPIVECQPLPWWQVAEMLQAKIQKLCPTRLTAENINHLKRRLFGRGDVSDDELVTLKKFCFDKLEKTDSSDDNTQLNFSFWKWFIGIYNLLDKYLLNFWKDGLIMGFVSKDEAKEKLKRCKNGRSGTFLLRFSDQNITDSQGVKSVFGHLTACVLIIKEDVDGRKKKKIYDMDVAGHKKLKEKNLANILKMTQDEKPGKIYQYLYPGDRTREDTFDNYCDKDAVVPGYTGTRDAFVVHLDQQFAALEIKCGKHARSPSVDSGIDAADTSSLNSSLSFNGYSVSAAKIKKPRVSANHPTIAKMLQNGSSDVLSPQSSPFAVPSPVNPGQSPSYPAQSPAPSAMSPVYSQTPSPAQSTNSLSQDVYGSSFTTQTAELQQAEMPGQGSPKFGSLPTVIEDFPMPTVSTDAQNVVPMSGNSICIQGNACATNPSPQGNGSDATPILIEDDNGQMTFVSFGTGTNEVIVQQLSGHSSLESTNEVIVQQLSGHSSLESNSSCQSSASHCQQNAQICPAQTEDPYMVSLGNNMFKRREPVTSTVPEQQEFITSLQNNPELVPILALLSTATPDLIKNLQIYLDQNVAPVVNDDGVQMSTEIDSTQPFQAVTTSGTPHLTSSGSMSDAFNFSPNEIAEGQEMNSGTIDTSVFATVDSSGMMS